VNVDVSNKITKEFIKFNPIVIVLRRRRKIPVPGGGWKWVDDSLIPAQTCRLVRRNNASDAYRRTLSDGRIVVEEARLVFEIGANVQDGDLFQHGDTTWEISRVTGMLSTSAEVFRHD